MSIQRDATSRQRTTTRQPPRHPVPGRILIADPDPTWQTLASSLRAHGADVVVCGDGESALAEILAGDVDLMLCELRLPDIDGLELLNRAREASAELAIVMVTAFGTVEDAVHAMRCGATDFLTKPFSEDQLTLATERALEQIRLVRENTTLRAALDDRVRLDNLIGTDPRMQAVFKTIGSVAPTRTTVLLTGESGTGKTLLARAIHNLSDRKDAPFIEVNCGALPESLLESELFGHVRGAFTGAVKDRAGKFEAAAGGTIFLDEIGTSTPGFQVKLLRVLQDRVFERVGDHDPTTVDVRVVLATNLDLPTEVREGRFREDLYYRINVVTVEMPPLRARPGDIRYLAEHFLRRFAAENGRSVHGFDPAAIRALVAAPWPGNVRQLENVIERAVVLSDGDEITAADLPTDLGTVAQPVGTPAGAPPAGSADAAPVVPLRTALEIPERRIIEHALAVFGGNRQETAAALGINRSTLFNKMRKFDLLREPHHSDRAPASYKDSERD